MTARDAFTLTACAVSLAAVALVALAHLRRALDAPDRERE